MDPREQMPLVPPELIPELFATGETHPGDETAPGSKQSGETSCPRCKGSGSLGQLRCPDCGGTGTITAIVGDA